MPLLNKYGVDRAFNKVEIILNVNQALLDSIEAGLLAVVDGDVRGVVSGDDAVTVEAKTVIAVVYVLTEAFAKLMPYFSMYYLYCSNYAKGNQYVQERLRRDPEFEEAVVRCEQTTGKALLALMCEPFQRICQYHLLFTSLESKLSAFLTNIEVPEDVKKRIEECLKEVRQTCTAVKVAADEVNKKIGDVQALERLIEIYNELGGHQNLPNFLEPHREFLESYEVDFEHADGRVERDQLLFVFNDLCIVAQMKASVKAFRAMRSRVSSSSQFARSFRGRKSELWEISSRRSSSMVSRSPRRSTLFASSFAPSPPPRVGQVFNIKHQISYDACSSIAPTQDAESFGIEIQVGGTENLKEPGARAGSRANKRRRRRRKRRRQRRRYGRSISDPEAEHSINGRNHKTESFKLSFASSEVRDEVLQTLAHQRAKCRAQRDSFRVALQREQQKLHRA